MKKYFFLPLFLLLATLISCNNTSDNPEKVKTLDSLNTELAKAETELNSLDTAGILSASEKINKNFFTLKEYKPDTLSKEEGAVVENFLDLKIPFDTYLKKREKFMKELAYTKEQLRTLSHDLNKNLIAEEKVDEFFHTEQNKAKEILESAKLTVKTMNESLLKADTINSLVQTLISKYKSLKDSTSAK